jgi:hypothetical protein
MILLFIFKVLLDILCRLKCLGCNDICVLQFFVSSVEKVGQRLNFILTILNFVNDTLMLGDSLVV